MSLEQAVQEAIRLAERGKSRPINRDEAARGKLDFVQVREWGSGEPAQLDDLQVSSFAGNFVADDGPFYVSLARQLELLEAKGALAAAQPAGPLPPFERWSMAGPRYVQLLTDLLRVHTALESAIAAAQSAASLKGYEEQEACRHALQALLCFAPASGMHRSKQLQADLSAISASASLPDASAFAPGGHALAFAQTLESLKNSCSRTDPRGWTKAVLRIIANAYCVYVTNLSMGTRIGSAASEKLNLFQAGAISTWRAFPEQVGRNPVVTFAELVNKAGSCLTPQQRQTVIDELAACMIRTSTLLLSLAHED